MIDVEHFQSLKTELQINQFELKETKERAMSVSTRLNELESQHLKSVRLVNLLIMKSSFFFSIVDSRIE